jgi:acyl-CoA hydrolase
MPLRTKYKTQFLVLPTHCNFRLPQICGGKFMLEIDLCAAAACSELLQFSDTPCDHAVTHVANHKFINEAAEMGDLVFLEAEITELKQNAIVLNVQGWRQQPNIKYPKKVQVVSAEYVFVTKQGDSFRPHKLKLEDNLGSH